MYINKSTIYFNNGNQYCGKMPWGEKIFLHLNLQGQQNKITWD